MDELLSLRISKRTTPVMLYNVMRAITHEEPIVASRNLVRFAEKLLEYIGSDVVEKELQEFARGIIGVFREKFGLKDALELIKKHGFMVNERSLEWAYRELGIPVSGGVAALILRLLRTGGFITNVFSRVLAIDIREAILNMLRIKGMLKIGYLRSKFGEEITNLIVDLIRNDTVIVTYRGRILEIPPSIENIDRIPSRDAEHIDRAFLEEWTDYHGVKWYRISIPDGAKVLLKM